MEHGNGRFQFGSRRLLLWTAVVALYLGFLTEFVGDVLPCVVLTCWLVGIGVVRRGNRLVAALCSAAVGILLWPSVPPLPLDRLEGVAVGLLFFACVEGICRAVNWADEIMRTKGRARKR